MKGDKDFQTHPIAVSIRQLQAHIGEWAKEKGWHDPERNDGECIALMHSELSEALEGLRKPGPSDKIPDYTQVEEELADVIIRILQYGDLRDLDLAGAVIAKMRYNQDREYKHGKKF